MRVGPPPCQDRHIVRRFIRSCHQRMGIDSQMRMLDSLKGLSHTPCGGALTVGTACSGTDCVVLILANLQAFWEANYNIKVRFEHVFSAEVEPSKRAWLMSQHSPQCVFERIEDLVAGMAKDSLTQNVVPISNVQVFIYSAECDNDSGLSRKRNLAAYQTESHTKSGSTMRAGLDYVRIATPPMVCNENVRSIV